MKKEDDYTFFGNEKIKKSEKKNRVNSVFKSVSSKYDLMNDIMSLGVHRLWKNSMIEWMSPRRGQTLLDVAGGTGDIAFKFLEKTSYQSEAVVLDLTENMMVEGLKKSMANINDIKINWICGDAMSLPFASNSFDIYSIAFGIRNVTDISVALKEAFRVLKPGGRIIILEFSTLSNEILQKYYDFYSFKIIPQLGKYIAQDEESYQYLVESIRKFPEQENFAEIIRNCGFSKVKYRNLSLGISALHSGWKI